MHAVNVYHIVNLIVFTDVWDIQLAMYMIIISSR
jgi:hypothetical protein